MTETNLKELLSILAHERAAIVNGNYEKVSAMSERKSALLNGLRRGRHGPESLAKIANAVQHNQNLLAAAIKGIGDARERLAELSKVRSKLSVYNRSGQMSDVNVLRPGLEKKA